VKAAFLWEGEDGWPEGTGCVKAPEFPKNAPCYYTNGPYWPGDLQEDICTDNSIHNAAEQLRHALTLERCNVCLPKVNYLELVDADEDGYMSNPDRYFTTVHESNPDRIIEVPTGANLSMRVVFKETAYGYNNVGSVKFGLNDNDNFKIENNADYYLGGNRGYDDVFPVDELTDGDFTVTVKTYPGPDATGPAGESYSGDTFTVTFTINRV
jgi:hypothetical protein